MRRHGTSTTALRWLASALAASLALALVACAGRRPAEEPPTRDAAATPIVASTPLPAPTPTPVPPALACVGDADCALTPYPRPVPSAAGCYCPTCPQPRNAAMAAANEESWQRLCGAAWAEGAGCAAPMCARPGVPACVGGACRPAVSDPAAGAPPG
ncbi:MAG TPA: hypothetical protein VFS60_06355 [Thermoanaerobaculia bacterium]|nr:hypothetical protein [Thermoanaerobaculia bacterium]